MIEPEELSRIIEKEKKRGKRIVFTNGCFDLLHPGHIHLLRQAKEEGDILIVGLNSDASLKRLKGKERPLIPEEERAEIIASLEMVDYVVIFQEDTPYSLIKKLKPHVLVKGEDWRDKGVVGRDIVESEGGKVKLVNCLPGYSTRYLIQKIKNA